MALRRMLSARFHHAAKHSTPSLPNARQDHRRLLISAATGVANSQILLQQPAVPQSEGANAISPPPIRFLFPSGDSLIDRIRSSMMRGQIRRDEIAPPPSRSGTEFKGEDIESSKMSISVADARKLLKASRIEAARARLRMIPKSYITYAEFAEICLEAASGSDESAREISAALDQSGAVVVLSGIVFLRPDQVVRAIESTIFSQPIERQQRSELNEMEAQKAIIDMKAQAQVKRELWAGLGLIVIQTAGFMRLTFWELSWDVMEPICFFTASIYFMLGYFFFLRTAKEPSFEAFFASRFAAKQRRLMKSQSFDLQKLNKLRKNFNADSHDCVGSSLHSASCDCIGHHHIHHNGLGHAHHHFLGAAY